MQRGCTRLTIDHDPVCEKTHTCSGAPHTPHQCSGKGAYLGFLLVGIDRPSLDMIFHKSTATSAPHCRFDGRAKSANAKLQWGSRILDGNEIR